MLELSWADGERFTHGVPATGILQFEDTVSPGRPVQFYRAVQE